MKIESLAIPDVKLITPNVFRDARGTFCETWNAQAFADAGIDATFVQDNHAASNEPGTVRGLHYQIAPMAQDKLVRVVRGAVCDVAVDLRRGSPTYGRHVKVLLSAENGIEMWVPKGFAHGYVTREPDTVVLYKVTAYYAPGCERGILWNDPRLAIDWGLEVSRAILSDKDRALPMLADAEPAF
jgi:dTDP-4-dehydrorhamnose 3,5-epimerase